MGLYRTSQFFLHLHIIILIFQIFQKWWIIYSSFCGNCEGGAWNRRSIFCNTDCCVSWQMLRHTETKKYNTSRNKWWIIQSRRNTWNKCQWSMVTFTWNPTFCTRFWSSEGNWDDNVCLNTCIQNITVSHMCHYDKYDFLFSYPAEYWKVWSKMVGKYWLHQMLQPLPAMNFQHGS